MENKNLLSSVLVIVIGLMMGTTHADEGLKVKAEMAEDERGIVLSMAVSEEIEETNMVGNKITRLVEASSVVPGDRLVYTTTVSNRSKELAENVAVVNPIPENTTYLEGSAQGNNAVVTFSVDGGKTFDLPQNLTVTDANGDSRTAIATDYTHIRWVMSSLSARTESDVVFHAQLD